MRNEFNTFLQHHLIENCEHTSQKCIDYIQESVCIKAITFTKTPHESKVLSRQINDKDNKQWNDCSINNLQFSKTLQAHNMSTDECNDKNNLTTDMNKCNNKLNSTLNMLTILNVSEESEN